MNQLIHTHSCATAEVKQITKEMGIKDASVAVKQQIYAHIGYRNSYDIKSVSHFSGLLL